MRSVKGRWGRGASTGESTGWTQDDQSLLHGLPDNNVRMGCPEAPLWAMWEFAMAKGEALLKVRPSRVNSNLLYDVQINHVHP